MLILLIGGASSGKSAFGEGLCQYLGGRSLYIATMRPEGPEAKKRIARHQALRADKGFDTLEFYDRLSRLQLPEYKAYNSILLECAGNLVADHLFLHKESHARVVRIMLDGIQRMHEQVSYMVIVTNDVFQDGVGYEEPTATYINCLAEINRHLAQRADVVAELVCGLPVWLKGKGVIPD